MHRPIYGLPDVGFLAAYDRVLFDIDGTILMDTTPLAGASALVELLRAAKKSVCFGTNASALRGFEVAEKLSCAGIAATATECLTAVEALAKLLQDTLADQSIAALAPERVVGLLADLGVNVHPVCESPRARGSLRHLIVAGLASGIGVEALEETSRLLDEDATLFVTNLDIGMVTAHGTLPGPATTVDRIGQRCGYIPKTIVAGKPSLNFVRCIEELRPCSGRTLVVGDMLRSDIALANLAGWDSLLILTGAARQSDVEDWPDQWRPTMIATDLTEVLDVCVRAR